MQSRGKDGRIDDDPEEDDDYTGVAAVTNLDAVSSNHIWIRLLQVLDSIFQSLHTVAWRTQPVPNKTSLDLEITCQWRSDER